MKFSISVLGLFLFGVGPVSANEIRDLHARCVYEELHRSDAEIADRMERVTEAFSFMFRPECPEPVINPMPEMLSNHAANMMGLVAHQTLTDKSTSAEVNQRLAACVDRKLAEQMQALLASAQVYNRKSPPGFEISRKIEDSATGFKAEILKNDNPSSPDSPVTVAAIGGTVTWTDVKQDLKLGKDQLYVAYHQLAPSLEAQLLDGKNVLITGHSLGGGLTEALAYLIQLDLEQKGRPEALAHLGVVTFNGFGGKELLQTSGFADVDKMGTDRQLHYEANNFRNDGDVVSLVGTHLGPLKTLWQPDKGDILSGIQSPIQSHRIRTLEINATEGGIRAADDDDRLLDDYLNYYFTGLAKFSSYLANKI